MRIVSDVVGILEASLLYQRKAGSLKAVRTKLSLQIDFHTFDTIIKDWRRQNSSGGVEACTNDFLHSPSPTQKGYYVSVRPFISTPYDPRAMCQDFLDSGDP